MIAVPVGHGVVALIDDTDAPLIAGYCWCVCNGYARGSVYVSRAADWRPDRYRYKYRRVYMHRLLLNADSDMEVDHINGDRLDNRRANLRVCTRASNSRNAVGKANRRYSRFKGVTWKKGWKWIAQITVNYQRIYLGGYDSEEKAAQAYNRAALQYFGEYARLNDIGA